MFILHINPGFLELLGELLRNEWFRGKTKPNICIWNCCTVFQVILFIPSLLMEYDRKRQKRKSELPWKYKTSKKQYPAAHRIALVLGKTANQMDGFWIPFEIILVDVENNCFIDWQLSSKDGWIWSDVTTIRYHHHRPFNCNCNKKHDRFTFFLHWRQKDGSQSLKY